MTDKNADKQKVLVTGASGGIGLAVLQAFAREGYSVCGTSTRDAGIRKVTRALDEEQLEGMCVLYDVSEERATERLTESLKAHDFTPDILVNNLGITRDQLLMRMSEEDWTQVLDINLTSVYRLSKACLRNMMKARRGRIINISSVVALSGNPGQCNYTASKAGMLGFSRSLAIEVANRGVTVNCVAPGFIETPMTNKLTGAQRDVVLGRIPAGRFGQAEEVAAVVLFLASDAGAYITGETINISGGLYMS